jgi:hypothetical protein
MITRSEQPYRVCELECASKKKEEEEDEEEKEKTKEEEEKKKKNRNLLPGTTIRLFHCLIKYTPQAYGRVAVSCRHYQH